MDPLILLLINCIVFALPILFGVFTAKRLNFIHGFLVAIDWYVFVTGFYLLALRFNNTAFFANIVDFFNLYFEYFLSVPLKVANSLVTNLSNSFDLAYPGDLQDGLNGYNAAYVRRLKQAVGGEDRMPKLAFKHVLTALKFQAQLEDAGLTSDEVKVSRLRLVNATNKILMRIAKSEEDVAGYLEPELVSQGKGDIWIRQVASASGSGSLNQVLSSDPVDLGAPVLVEPGQSYTVEIDIVIGGNTTTLQCPVERANKEQPFMAGYEYTLLVKVKSPVEVEIVETSLEEWKPGGGTGDITFGE